MSYRCTTAPPLRKGGQPYNHLSRVTFSHKSQRQNYQPGIERQALADIAIKLCCHSNAPRAPIANLPTSAQLGATPTIPSSYIRIRAVVWACDRGQTDRHADARDQYIHFASSIRLTRNVITGDVLDKEYKTNITSTANKCSCTNSCTEDTTQGTNWFDGTKPSEPTGTSN